MKDASKDFVEQLRTVHFTLLAVCLAAVVIVLSPSPTTINKASEQLNQIIEVNSGWRSEWVALAAEDLSHKHAECLGTVAPRDLAFGGDRFKAVIARRWAVRYSIGGIEPPRDGNFLPSTSAPNTLDDFRSFWNSSGSLICPLDAVLNPATYETRIWHPEVPIFYRPKTQLQALKPATGQKLPSKSFVWVLTEHYGAPSPDRPVAALLQIGNPYPYTIVTEPSPTSFPFSPRTTVLNSLHPHGWQDADFKAVFPELEQSTAGMQNLTLEHLRDILHAQEGASKEAFEAFGIKFPVEATTRWAVFLILSVQLYFWLHLSEYDRRQFADPNIAWIGMYPSLPARIIVVVTAFVIPTLVVLFLAANQKFVLQKSLNTGIRSGEILLSAFLAGLTMKTYVRMTRNTNPLRPAPESMTKAVST